uniref:DUF834 domain-containing protein n=1 Tax=Oryza glaberrima TaxID=4538 RepID=I1QAL9_ORYGL
MATEAALRQVDLALANEGGDDNGSKLREGRSGGARLETGGSASAGLSDDDNDDDNGTNG